MNIYVRAPRRKETDAPFEASISESSIGNEMREVAWLSFVVASLSIAGVALGAMLALAIDGYLV